MKVCAHCPLPRPGEGSPAAGLGQEEVLGPPARSLVWQREPQAGHLGFLGDIRNAETILSSGRDSGRRRDWGNRQPPGEGAMQGFRAGADHLALCFGLVTWWLCPRVEGAKGAGGPHLAWQLLAPGRATLTFHRSPPPMSSWKSLHIGPHKTPRRRESEMPLVSQTSPLGGPAARPLPLLVLPNLPATIQPSPGSTMPRWICISESKNIRAQKLSAIRAAEPPSDCLSKSWLKAEG